MILDCQTKSRCLRFHGTVVGVGDGSTSWGRIWFNKLGSFLENQLYAATISALVSRLIF